MATRSKMATRKKKTLRLKSVVSKPATHPLSKPQARPQTSNQAESWTPSPVQSLGDIVNPLWSKEKRLNLSRFSLLKMRSYISVISLLKQDKSRHRLRSLWNALVKRPSLIWTCPL